MLQDKLTALSSRLQLPFPADKFLPPCADRSLWDNLPAKERQESLKAGKEALERALPALPATLMMDFYRTGNRVNYEKPYFERRIMLFRMVKAFCISPEDPELLDGIINCLNEICGEWSWVIPAHNWPNDNALPPVDPPRVDLFAANTASMLSLTVHLLGDHLEKEAGRLADRVRSECRRRCIIPFMENDHHWWMGFVNDPAHGELNNWNPWIVDNCLHTLFLIEKDEAFLKKAVDRASAILVNYINVLPGDGGCDEGASYWDHAVGTLFDCLEILDWAGGCGGELINDPFMKRAASYITRMHGDGDFFINYADCVGRISHLPSWLIYRMGLALGDNGLKDLGISLFKDVSHSGMSHEEAFTPQRRIRNLLFPIVASNSTPLWERGEDCFPETQLAVKRGENLLFSCKGGHNGESHNHNDVGQFVLYGRKGPLLIDPGVGEYTRETFNEKRYTIWTMQSLWHNLPVINGIGQKEGKEHNSSRWQYHEGNGCSLGLEKAYPAEAGIHIWNRKFSWDNEESILLTDEWEFEKEDVPVEWHFLSLDEPELSGGQIIIINPWNECLTIAFDSNVIEKKEYKPFPPKDEKMGNWQRPGLWRTTLSNDTAPRTGKQVFTMKISLKN